jgi:uncharacterized protein (TIGR00299 family) protein
MTLAYLDCPTGVAGDMLLAALFDLGLPRTVVEEPLARLGLAGAYDLTLEQGRSGGLRGTRVGVAVLETQPPHRRWLELRGLITASGLDPQLRERVLAVFGLLAEAEAAVHGHAPEQVHFHEVGAVDALVDVVGVCAGLLHFDVDRLVCAPPPGGHGTVRTAHGVLPLPAPAVLELARRHAIPLAGAGGMPPGELTTPTGMALIAAWAERFGPAPPLQPKGVGIGLGHRVLDRPNLLRLLLAAPAEAGAEPRPETVLQQQAQIDDATGEDVAFLAEELRGAGALDVFTTAVQMKKGRSGVLVTVLVAPENAAALRAVWWRHGTTLGVREQLQHRWCLVRQQQSVRTPWGPVRLKAAALPGGGQRLKPEHDDLVTLARRHQLSLQEVREAVRDALRLAAEPTADDHNATAPPPAG